MAEAPRGRGRLLTTIAPHLIEAQPFLWPPRTPVIEHAYSMVGAGAYDALTRAGPKGRKTAPIQRHLSKVRTMRCFPEIKRSALVGIIEFYDARVDDARLVIMLIRTIVEYGAAAASRVKVTKILRDGYSRACGIKAVDLENGNELTIETDRVINVTDVWARRTRELVGGTERLKVLTNKGIHIVIPRECLKATTGLFLRTEKSILLITPWQHYWVTGATDVIWYEQLKYPVPISEDVSYVLDHASEVPDPPLTRDDIIGTYAGLRSLFQLKVFDESKSTKASRKHTVTEVIPGMVAIAGGKLATYRVMIEDAVDFALGQPLAKARPSVAAQLPLLGAEGFDVVENQVRRLGVRYGFDANRLHHLVRRYGSKLPDLLAAINEDSSLGKFFEVTPQFLRVEVHHACAVESALHLEDILVSRARLDPGTHDRDGAAVDEVAKIAAAILGWDETHLKQEKSNYRERIATELAAEEWPTGATVSAVRIVAEDIVG